MHSLTGFLFEVNWVIVYNPIAMHFINIHVWFKDIMGTILIACLVNLKINFYLSKQCSFTY